jgi:hypothetical protein
MLHEKALGIGANPTADTGNFPGIWENPLGSTVTFEVTGNFLNGIFVSGEGGGGPIMGFVAGNLIAFSVNFATTGITAWVGELVTINNVDTITALWQMTTTLPSDNEPTGAIFAGSDTFVRIG